jgi:hypothetical protein
MACRPAGPREPAAKVAFGVCGTLLAVPLEDLPDWLPPWCLEHLGGEPVGVLFQLRQVSAVFGLRLAGGRDVVVKARAGDGRAASCVAAQAVLAGRGFPCARPLTLVTAAGSLAVHAEEFRPGDELLRGDSPAVAARYGDRDKPWEVRYRRRELDLGRDKRRCYWGSVKAKSVARKRRPRIPGPPLKVSAFDVFGISAWLRSGF